MGYYALVPYSAGDSLIDKRCNMTVVCKHSRHSKHKQPLTESPLQIKLWGGLCVHLQRDPQTCGLIVCLPSNPST